MSEWCTIESDPGVFTELIKNIGVKGVQVEEILDLDTLEVGNEQVFGLIFLFKYIPNSGYTPNILSHWDEDLYFAKQVIVNACATQAILAILMNNADKISLGETLSDLKAFSLQMDPYMKGLAISNCEKIKEEHNKFSRPEPFVFTKTSEGTEKNDVFHFVGYIHFKNSIYEIDGLKEGPILIEENVKYEEWISKVKPAIMSRISLYANNEIKFNLLAVIPDKLEKAIELEKDLEERKNYLQSVLTGGDLNMTDERFKEYNKMSKEDMEKSLKDFEGMIMTNKVVIDDEIEKKNKYKRENERRQHNYIPLIFELLKIMSEKGKLEEVYNEAQKSVQEKNTNTNK